MRSRAPLPMINAGITASSANLSQVDDLSEITSYGIDTTPFFPV